MTTRSVGWSSYRDTALSTRPSLSTPTSLPLIAPSHRRNAVDYSRINPGDIIWRNKDPALDSRMKAYTENGNTQVRMCMSAWLLVCRSASLFRPSSLFLSLCLFLSPSSCPSLSLPLFLLLPLPPFSLPLSLFHSFSMSLFLSFPLPSLSNLLPLLPSPILLNPFLLPLPLLRCWMSM